MKYNRYEDSVENYRSNIRRHNKYHDVSRAFDEELEALEEINYEFEIEEEY